MNRYSRQTLFEPVGDAGQNRLSASRVLLIGCGALGSHMADALVRAGVGMLRIVDRDVVELNNLQRQVLFDEEDVAAKVHKAEAARRKLVRINSQVLIEAVVADVSRRNIEELAAGVDLLLDGTDNFATRYLINDVAVKTLRPWIFGACAGSIGMCIPILPGETPCLRCIFDEGPPPELTPTANTMGILASTVSMVAAHQVVEAIKILTGHPEAVDRRLVQFDLWKNRRVHLNVAAMRTAECTCCGLRKFEHLDGGHS